MATSRRRSRTRSRAKARTRRLPPRDAHGRFTRRVRRRRARARPARRRIPASSVVLEASRRSVAGPALVKRRWWRIDGPVDPSLPDGYAYARGK